MNSKNRKVLITGASSGIGRAFAEMLISEGFMVYGTSRNPPSEDSPIHWLKFDGSSREAIDQFLSKNQSLLPLIDILILNAGSGILGEWNEWTPPIIRQQIDLLFHATADLSLAHCQANPNRPITQVWVTSLAGELSLPYLPIYASAKSALSSLAKNLQIAKDPHNLTLIDFRPGDFQTDFNQNLVRLPTQSTRRSPTEKQLEANLQNSPKTDLACRDLLRAIRNNKPGIVRSGSFFQTHIAPTFNRILPTKWMQFFTRRYFKIS